MSWEIEWNTLKNMLPNETKAIEDAIDNSNGSFYDLAKISKSPKLAKNLFYDYAENVIECLNNLKIAFNKTTGLKLYMVQINSHNEKRQAFLVFGVKSFTPAGEKL